MPKTCKIMPKWGKFAKSGHTDHDTNRFHDLGSSAGVG